MCVPLNTLRPAALVARLSLTARDNPEPHSRTKHLWAEESQPNRRARDPYGGRPSEVNVVGVTGVGRQPCTQRNQECRAQDDHRGRTTESELLHVQMAHRDVAAYSKNQQAKAANKEDVHGRHAIVGPDCRGDQPHRHEQHGEPHQLAMRTRLAGQTHGAAAESQPDRYYQRAQQWTATFEAKLLEQQAQEDRNSGSRVRQCFPGFARRGTKVWWWRSAAYERQNETANADRKAEKYPLLDQQHTEIAGRWQHGVRVGCGDQDCASQTLQGGDRQEYEGGRRSAARLAGQKSTQCKLDEQHEQCGVSDFG